MTVDIQLRGLKADEATRRQFEADLKALGRLLPVARAEMVLEHQPQTAPAYQVVARLAVAGPDIHAAARDHAWPAAWQKVLARLREQIEARRRQPSSAKADRTKKAGPDIHSLETKFETEK